MKNPLIGIITITLLSLFLTQACDRASNDVQNAESSVIEAERDLEIAQSEIEADVRIYRQEIANKIRENNIAIADIKEKIQDEEPEIKAAHEVRIANIERLNSELKREIDNFRVTNRDSWDDFKDQFSDSMDDLGNSLENFFSETTTSRN
jgi:hypothetical protein